jgi:phosphate/sulfate permease
MAPSRAAVGAGAVPVAVAMALLAVVATVAVAAAGGGGRKMTSGGEVRLVCLRDCICIYDLTATLLCTAAACFTHFTTLLGLG